jgi:hypothetical protein
MSSGDPASEKTKDPKVVDVLEEVSSKLSAISSPKNAPMELNSDRVKPGEQVASEIPRVNPVSGGSAADHNPTPPANHGPATGPVIPATDHKNKSSVGENVAQQSFYSMNATEVCEIAFKGLANIKPKFSETWSNADLNGAAIVESMTLDSFGEFLTEIQNQSNEKIAFAFQTNRIIDLKARPQNKVPMSQCIDPDIQADFCNYAKLTVANWHSYKNNEIIMAMCIFVGPKNGTQAKVALKEEVFEFEDRSTHQEFFSSALSKFIREKENVLGDITVSADVCDDPSI